MCRHGRLTFPSEDEAFGKVWSEWKSCPILSKGLLEEAQCLPTKELVTIEDCSESALPASTTLTHTTNPAEKCCQLGKDAYHSFLRVALGTLGTKSSKPVVLVVDLLRIQGILLWQCSKRSLPLRCRTTCITWRSTPINWRQCYSDFFWDRPRIYDIWLSSCFSLGQVEWAKQHHIEHVFATS